MGDEVVDVDLAVHVPVHNLRHIGAAACTAKSRALPFAAGHQLKGPRADLGARFCHANDDAAAPALVCAFQRLAHDLGVANALKAVVGTTIGQLNNRVHHVFGVLGIDEMRHAEFARHGFAFGVQINADDLVGTHHLQALDHIESNATQAKYNSICACFYFRRKDDCANASGDATADVANLVERRILANFGQRDFGRHRVVAEGGGTHVMKDGFAVQAEATGGVGHQALALRPANQLAQIGFAREAELALTTLGRVQRNDVIAFLQ